MHSFKLHIFTFILLGDMLRIYVAIFRSVFIIAIMMNIKECIRLNLTNKYKYKYMKNTLIIVMLFG